ncbi:hypothetical protein D3C76_1142570 [compost metagenome]
MHLQIADQILTAFQQRQCTGNAIVAARVSRLKQRTAITGHSQAFVGGAFMDQVKQANQARPGAAALTQAFVASATGAAVHLMAQPFQAVGLLINRVVDRHQAAGFCKQGNDAAHDDARAGDVQIFVIVHLPLLLRLLDGDMGSGDQLFHSLPHALAQYAGELGLALA